MSDDKVLPSMYFRIFVWFHLRDFL